MVFGWMTVAHKQKSFPVLSKRGGGVIMTLFFLTLVKVSGADGILSPPGFLFPVKEQVASLLWGLTTPLFINYGIFY